MPRHPVASLAAAALAWVCACTGPSAPRVDGTDVSSWKAWPRVNADRMWSRAHARVWVDVHVAPGYTEAYRSGQNPMPRGTRIVKAIYASRDAATPLRLTAMVKMKPGYDDDDNDWYYAVVAADGTTTRAAGRIDMCINCHILSDGDDYLYRPRGSGSWKDAFPAQPPR